MKIHFISDNNMQVSDITFGASLKGLFVGNQRPNYITIGAAEFEATIMNEKQLLLYLNQLKKSLTFGGTIYLEIANFS